MNSIGALTIPEFAEMFKIGRSTVYEIISAGALRTFHVGRRVLISYQAIEEWRQRLEMEMAPMGNQRGYRCDDGDIPNSINFICGLNRWEEPPPAIYFLCFGDNVIYVGQTNNLAQRIRQHRADRTYKKEFDRVYAVNVDAKNLDDIEAAFIRYLKPQHNAAGAYETNSVIYRKKDEQILESFGAKISPRGSTKTSRSQRATSPVPQPSQAHDQVRD